MFHTRHPLHSWEAAAFQLLKAHGGINHPQDLLGDLWGMRTGLGNHQKGDVPTVHYGAASRK